MPHSSFKYKEGVGRLILVFWTQKSPRFMKIILCMISVRSNHGEKTDILVTAKIKL